MYYGVGELPEVVEPGDFFLTRREGSLMGSLISFGQDLRLPYEDAKWSHAVLVTSNSGDTKEALEFGIEESSIERYRHHEVEYFPLLISKEDREQMVYFADEVYASKERYGYVTIASVIFSLATGSKFVFGRAGTSICSGFVAEALCRAGYVFPKPPAYMTPGDLNYMFKPR